MASSPPSVCYLYIILLRHCFYFLYTVLSFSPSLQFLWYRQHRLVREKQQFKSSLHDFSLTWDPMTFILIILQVNYRHANLYVFYTGAPAYTNMNKSLKMHQATAFFSLSNQNIRWASWYMNLEWLTAQVFKTLHLPHLTLKIKPTSTCLTL